METAFTPFQSLLGGALIGLAAVLLMALHGRVAGATGILSGLLWSTDGTGRAWRGAVVTGMILAPALYAMLTGAMPEVTVTAPSTGVLAIGGVLVGVGVSLANGCTSGHGVCGMARLSGRSIVATLTFMVATGVTVYVLRHVMAGGGA